MNRSVRRDPASPPSTGTTLAVIKGKSSGAILRNTVANLRHVPAFVVGRFRRRDRSLWVFGNIHGFRDSPRYLAEHVLHERDDVTAAWIAHSDAELKAAQAAGLHAALKGTIEAKQLQSRAGVAILTHGFRDLDLALVSGAYLVYLWHGTPLKRIALDVRESGKRRRPLRVRAATAAVRWIQARAFGLVSLFVAASELDQERFSTAFATPRARIKILGSPRFDVIRGGPEYGRVVSDDLRARLGFQPQDFVVLWLPTHRAEYGDAAWLPALTRADVDRALAGTRVTLLVKAHPLSEMAVYEERLPDHPQVRLLPEKEIDVNCLLHVADALVTDYSSAVCDYVILERPVQFFAPDVEKYESNRGLYEPYDSLTLGRHHLHWASLLDAVRADSVAGEGAAAGYDIARAVADYCRNNTSARACSRVADAIVEAVLH